MIDPPIQILKRARKLLAEPDHWCQRAAARNHNETPTDPTSEFACAWCLMGAIHRATAEGKHSPVHALKAARALSVICADTCVSGSVASWNDEPGRTHEQVLFALDHAIARLKGFVS